MPGTSPQDRVGSVIGDRYRVEKVIGQGGMGVVLAARHKLTDRRVAIKVILPHFAQDEDVLARFFQEAKTAAALAHPNVVDTLDMGVMKDSGEPYLVLELLDGTDLAHVLAERGRMEPEELLPIVLPVLDALAAAHEHGIIHRDLKPENVFIGHDARGRPVPKLLDFGIAKLVEGETKVKTQAGGVLGTPQYMSPEQAMASGTIGPASDVWAMGAVLYECLSGTRPYDGDNPTEVLVSICTMDPRPVRSVYPDIPEAFAAVVHRALQRKVDDRYKTAEELGGALLAAAEATGIEVPGSVAGLFAETRARIGDEVLVRPAPHATGPIEREDVKLPLDHTVPLEGIPEIAPEEAPAPEPEPARSKAPPLIAAAVLLLGLGGFAIFWMNRAPEREPGTGDETSTGPGNGHEVEGPDVPEGVDPPPPPPEPAGPPTRRLESDPPGAEVWERGVRLGLTPIDLAIDAEGERTVTVRLRGHEEREVSLGPDSSEVLRVTLPESTTRVPGRRRGAPELVPR